MRPERDLFGKRVAKPKPAAEFLVHCMIADTLRLGLTPGWVWFHPPNGGERSAFVNRQGKRVSLEGGRLARMGVKAGVSDFILVSPPIAQLHALELKRKGEKPSDEQDAFLEAVRAAGGQAEWVDDYKRAIEVLHGWGALRITLQVKV